MLKLALAPVLIAQALATRARLPRLPEASGPREGRCGRGRRLRLLVTGDSSAAGVGVDAQHQALAEPLARHLATGEREVHWRLVARSGLNSRTLLDELRAAGPAPADVAVVVTGVNDVVDRLAPPAAVTARVALREWLQRECGVRHCVFTPVPPMHGFAGLPQPLRWVAGRDARAHDAALAEWTQTHADTSKLALTLPLDPQLLARDGFHPGPRVYALWASALAAHIARHQI